MTKKGATRMTGEGGAGMTRKEHCHYRVNQCLGTGMTRKERWNDRRRRHWDDTIIE
ncbi:hypothetical protein [Wolbachia endosymbiont of Zygogramma bicolorata]|uniref:hypothetical protein n=1 Tax=Wolbachia endosymbiont of Zygogramma bicolorata TaxID=3134048 RepID=UPI003DA7DFCC